MLDEGLVEIASLKLMLGQQLFRLGRGLHAIDEVTKASASPSPVNPGGTVTASWSGILTPTTGDWIGLFSSGAPDSAYLSWRYTTGAAGGSLPLSIPASLSPGTYELRLHANNGYILLATSSPITVS